MSGRMVSGHDGGQSTRASSIEDISAIVALLAMSYLRTI